MGRLRWMMSVVWVRMFLLAVMRQVSEMEMVFLLAAGLGWLFQLVAMGYWLVRE